MMALCVLFASVPGRRVPGRASGPGRNSRPRRPCRASSGPSARSPSPPGSAADRRGALCEGPRAGGAGAQRLQGGRGAGGGEFVSAVRPVAARREQPERPAGGAGAGDGPADIVLARGLAGAAVPEPFLGGEQPPPPGSGSAAASAGSCAGCSSRLATAPMICRRVGLRHQLTQVSVRSDRIIAAMDWPSSSSRGSSRWARTSSCWRAFQPRAPGTRSPLATASSRISAAEAHAKASWVPIIAPHVNSGRPGGVMPDAATARRKAAFPFSVPAG